MIAWASEFPVPLTGFPITLLTFSVWRGGRCALPDAPRFTRIVCWRLRRGLTLCLWAVFG